MPSPCTRFLFVYGFFFRRFLSLFRHSDRSTDVVGMIIILVRPAGGLRTHRDCAYARRTHERRGHSIVRSNEHVSASIAVIFARAFVLGVSSAVSPRSIDPKYPCKPPVGVQRTRARDSVGIKYILRTCMRIRKKYKPHERSGSNRAGNRPVETRVLRTYIFYVYIIFYSPLVCYRERDQLH